MSLPATPEDVPEAFRAAWMARDARALAALFADDADFVNVTGLWWRTRQEIEHAHAYALGSFFADTTLRLGRVAVRQLSADHATVHARMILDGQIDTDGKTLGQRRTVFLFVLERRDYGWIAVAAQNTDVVPGAETHAMTDGTLEGRDYR